MSSHFCLPDLQPTLLLLLLLLYGLGNATIRRFKRDLRTSCITSTTNEQRLSRRHKTIISHNAVTAFKHSQTFSRITSVYLVSYFFYLRDGRIKPVSVTF